MEIVRQNNYIDYDRLQESKQLFQKNTKITPIYHYTSIGGLEGILKEKKLRFTNIKYMNDKEEIIAGLDCTAKDFDVSEKDRDKLCLAYNSSDTQTFICCFSIEEDSLPMWNYYTKEINNQGYNIEFDVKKLVESILRNNSFLDGCDLSFGKVNYSKKNTSKYTQNAADKISTKADVFMQKLFLDIAKGMLFNQSLDIDESALKDWEKQIAVTERKWKRNDLPIYTYNGEICRFQKDLSTDYLFYVKRDCFIHEQEFRIVITVPKERLEELKDNEAYKFRVADGIMIPFLELGFSSDAVKSIRTSPTVQSDLVELSIQEFLKYCGFEIQDYSEFIKHSNVPVRF